MRRFIAHIGAPKTGTTAFQRFMKRGRADLLAAGWLTPSRSPITGHHCVLTEALGSPGADRPDFVEALASFRRDAADHPDHHLIVSCENLCMRDGRERAAAFARAAGELADERIVVLAVRDVLAHFNSGFAQRRKAMRNGARAFADYAANTLADGRSDWRAMVTAYEAAGFAVAVVPYDAAMKAAGTARTILSLPVFGDLATRLDWSEPDVENPSMGAIGLIIMDRVLDAALADDPTRGTDAPVVLRRRVAEVAKRRFDDRPFNGFTPGLAALVTDRLGPSDAWLAERFFGRPFAEILPPEPLAPLSPRTLDDLPAPLRAKVARVADRIVVQAREEGWLDKAVARGRR